jgi:hypothetical protein
MRTEDSTISLTCIEFELLLAALSYYEKRFKSERTETLADGIRVLRDKLLNAD